MKRVTYLLVIVFGTLLNINAQIPTTGLVAYYPFNGNANDESGNGNDGIVQGATLTADKFSNQESAYQFDGENDYIELPLSLISGLPQCQRRTTRRSNAQSC